MFEKTIEKSSLYYAIKNEHVKLIQWLLKHTHIDINFGIKIIPFLVNHPTMKIKYFVESTYKREIEKSTPLQLAVKQGNNEIIQLLSNETGNIFYCFYNWLMCSLNLY